MQALEPDFRSLYDDGLLKAARGETSLEEVIAVAGTTASQADSA
jgi:general secretion pathway protein E